MLRGIMFHAYGAANTGNTTLVDVTGTSRAYPYSTSGIYNSGMAINCGSGSSEYGLVVGSGSAPNTTDTYALQSLIPHGTDSGQLSYGSHTFESLLVSNNTAYFRIIRTFTNSSGASITVNEIGLYAKAQDSGYNPRIFCIARDVIPGGVTVGNNQTLTVRYKLSITVG